ncbi:MAG: glutamate racemase [Candidatus Xenobia bacterium]
MQTVIGMFDSGVGGLSVYEMLRHTVPQHCIVYVADAGFAPYGTKPPALLRERVAKVAQRLLEMGAQVIVVACNTATVTAIQSLRERFALPFVGMEPAVKPAARDCQRIVVLGTPSTVTNDHYRELCRRYAPHARVWHIGSAELVRQVEEGRLDDTSVLESLMAEPVAEGAQAVVIGCTHFSFLVPTIQRRWPDLQIHDGRSGTVARAAQICGGLAPASAPQPDTFWTTGAPAPCRFIDPPVTFSHLEL